MVRQVRLELTIPCLRGRCLDPIWVLTHGGTERTRTVIDLIDNQVPHLSATVPFEELAARVGFEPTIASFRAGGRKPNLAMINGAPSRWARPAESNRHRCI